MIALIHKELKLYSDNDEIFIDVADIVRKNNVLLNDNEIKDICTTYFKSAKQTRERLTKSDELFQLLHRANESLEYTQRKQQENSEVKAQ